MGRIRLETISDYHKHGYDLELWCRTCGRKVVLVPQWFMKRGEIGQVDKIERRLRCQCGARGSTVISSTMADPSGGVRRGVNWQDHLKKR
jgi:hypothetical protein